MAHAMPQVKGVDHRFVRAGEMSFHVALAGDEEADPVLLLHGFPEHWWAWREVIPRLAGRHRVIAMDLRGFGWSDIAWEGFEKENMADDVAGVIDALGLERVKLAGHGWGGYVGYLLALRRPELVERLVAISAPPPWTPLNRGSLGGLARLHHQLTLATPFVGNKAVEKRLYVNRLIRRWSRDQKNLKKDVQRIYSRDLKASTRARAAALLHRTWLTRELPAVLAGRYRGDEVRLTVPTLVIHSKRDPLLSPGLFNGISKQADELRVQTVPNAGHFLPEERPAVVADALLEFFGSGADAAPGTTRGAAPVPGA